MLNVNYFHNPQVTLHIFLVTLFRVRLFYAVVDLLQLGAVIC